MPRFYYSGKNVDGQVIEGHLNADDQTDLETRLLDLGVFLQTHRPALSTLRQHLLCRFKSSELTRVTRQLQILIASKIAAVEALQLVSDQLKDKTQRSVFESIILQVESGRSMADSFKDYPILFDDLYTSMIEAGESSGRLDFAFDSIATYREKRETTARKVRSALAYPLLVICVAALVVAALILYVVPVFSSMYENFNAELPMLTQQVVGMSGFLRENLWYLMGGVLLMCGLLVATSLNQKFQYSAHMLLVKLPLVKNLTTKLVSARFCRTMGALLTSGVDILYALQVASRTTGNAYVANAIEPAGRQVSAGQSLTDALEETKVFPRAVLRLTSSGEKTGQLGEMLSRAADYYESESDAEIQTLTSLIEPLITILLGVVVAFILVAMYLPLFELVGTI